MTKEKIVLAYSGGLDTTAIIPWLKDNYNDAEIIAVCVDVGQNDIAENLEEKATQSGVSNLYVPDVKKEFVQEYIYDVLRANVTYEGKYLLGTSMARPLIARTLVEIALKEGASAICHGATGKGNDQVRFELTIKALAPHLKVIAPWRMDSWSFGSREDLIAYLESKNIPLPTIKEKSYSCDNNLWHISHEGLELENPSLEPNYKNMLKMCVVPEEAPDEATYVELSFEKGLPTAINGEQMSPLQIMNKLNEVGAANAIGIIDIVENRVVGMKSRGVYETPGGTILMYAHKELEYLCLDKQSLSYKDVVGVKYAELIYSGEWYTPLREALSTFMKSLNETITGTVKLKLYKGNIISAGSSSPYSLYNEDFASFTTGDLYNHNDAAGFIKLFGLPIEVRAMMKGRNL
jgi:argininosuccinate synthase